IDRDDIDGSEMKHVENIDAAEIIEAIGVVSNMIYEGNDAAFDVPCNESLLEEVENYSKMELANIEKEYIPVVSASANVIDSNRTEGDIKKKLLTIKLDLKVSGYDKAMMEKIYSEEFEGSCKMNKLVEEVAKVLMKDKELNNKVEKKETDINGHNIPVVKVKNNDLVMDDNNDLVRYRMKDNNDRDEAPNGRAGNVSIGMGNIKGIQDEKMKYKYWHEFNFQDEKSWRDECLDCNEELVIKFERKEKSRLDIRNKANRLEDDGVKDKEIEVKIYDDFDEAVIKCI
ncbi:4272_t:CDS:2, partial [Gigaspora margarita]